MTEQEIERRAQEARNAIMHNQDRSITTVIADAIRSALEAEAPEPNGEGLNRDDQPCQNFKFTDGDSNLHDCPKCKRSAQRRFCGNCHTDHHVGGWWGCYEAYSNILQSSFKERWVSPTTDAEPASVEHLERCKKEDQTMDEIFGKQQDAEPASAEQPERVGEQRSFIKPPAFIPAFTVAEGLPEPPPGEWQPSDDPPLKHVPFKTVGVRRSWDVGEDGLTEPERKIAELDDALLGEMALHAATRAKLTTLEARLALPLPEDVANILNTHPQPWKKGSDGTAFYDVNGKTLCETPWTNDKDGALVDLLFKAPAMARRIAELERQFCIECEENKETELALKRVVRKAQEERDQLRAELAKLEDHVDLMVDEFKRIKSCSGSDSEIKQLCDRAITNTKQHVPVIVQRDQFEAELATAREENVNYERLASAHDKLRNHLATARAEIERLMNVLLLVRDKLSGSHIVTSLAIEARTIIDAALALCVPDPRNAINAQLVAEYNAQPATSPEPEKRKAMAQVNDHGEIIDDGTRQPLKDPGPEPPVDELLQRLNPHDRAAWTSTEPQPEQPPTGAEVPAAGEGLYEIHGEDIQPTPEQERAMGRLHDTLTNAPTSPAPDFRDLCERMLKAVKVVKTEDYSVLIAEATRALAGGKGEG